MFLRKPLKHVVESAFGIRAKQVDASTRRTELTLKYLLISQEDIESIYAHVCKEAGAATADRLIDALAGTCEDLAQFPLMGKARPELDDLGLSVRSINERGYLILYTSREEVLYIVRVLHGSRDIGRIELDGLTRIIDSP
jgi:toxin ParE1/3/4